MVGLTINLISRTHIYVVGPTIHVKGGLYIYLSSWTWLDISSDSISIIAVIDGCFKARQSEEAISILNIFNPPLNIFLCNSLILKLCTDGNMVNASKIFSILPSIFSCAIALFRSYVQMVTW